MSKPTLPSSGGRYMRDDHGALTPGGEAPATTATPPPGETAATPPSGKTSGKTSGKAKES